MYSILQKSKSLGKSFLKKHVNKWHIYKANYTMWEISVYLDFFYIYNKEKFFYIYNIKFFSIFTNGSENINGPVGCQLMSEIK